MAKEMDMVPYSPSPSPPLLGSRPKDSAPKKWRGKRRTNTGRTISPDMGRGEKMIKEVAKDMCVRSDSIIIDNNDKVSTEENKEESSKAGENAISNKEA
jgi:hypothetical protein